MKPKIRAVAFDFDGVIADTTQLKSDLFLKMFEGIPEYPLILAYEKKNQSLPRRRKLEDILSVILRRSVPEHIDFYLEQYAKDLDIFLPKAPMIKGFPEFFNYLQRESLFSFVVSSGIKEEIESYLGPSQTQAFVKIFDASTPKPSALKLILNQHNLKNTELLFIGDNISDFQAAQEVPCDFVAINPNGQFPSEVRSFKDFSVFDLKLLR